MPDLRLEPGTAPWEPAEGARSREGWHLYDHPRWGYFELDGERFAFHRHETVGESNHGPALWTYRPLDEASLRRLALSEEGGRPWNRVYQAWRSETPAWWWAVTNDDDLEIVRFGALVPPTLDDDDWAASFARAQGIESVAAD